jgi:hypothetical protein
LGDVLVDYDLSSLAETGPFYLLGLEGLAEVCLLGFYQIADGF